MLRPSDRAPGLLVDPDVGTEIFYAVVGVTLAYTFHIVIMEVLEEIGMQSAEDRM